MVKHSTEKREYLAQGYKTFFSCSTQLSMKFSLLINRKMLTIVGIFISINAEKFLCSAMYS